MYASGDKEMKRLITTRLCPNCKLVRLNFEQNLDHLRRPVGGITAWCWVCSRGFYLRSGRVHDIVIRCSRIGEFVPAYRCRECERADECLREMMQKPIVPKLPIFKVKPEVVFHG